MDKLTAVMDTGLATYGLLNVRAGGTEPDAANQSRSGPGNVPANSCSGLAGTPGVVCQAGSEAVSAPFSYAISGISYLLNIDDVSYFSRLFEKQLGLSPRQFREQASRLPVANKRDRA